MWPSFGRAHKDQSYYHISPTYLPSGQILQPLRYIGHDERILLVAQEALDMGESALRLLNLVDALISYSMRVEGQSWPKPVDFPAVLNEVILERVREREFEDRPRRIGSIFLFSGIEHATRFRAENQGGAGVLVECSADSARIFEADTALIQPPKLHGDIQEELAQAEQRARTYWSGNLGPDALVEVIAEGEVKVLRILETAA